MKDQKMLSFRVNSTLHEDFKSFCTRNEVTIKESLTKVIKLLLEAEENENVRTGEKANL